MPSDKDEDTPLVNDGVVYVGEEEGLPSSKDEVAPVDEDVDVALGNDEDTTLQENKDEIDLVEAPQIFYEPPESNDQKIFVQPEKDFSRLDVRVGKIIEVKPHLTNSWKLYMTFVDVGESWPRPIGVELARQYYAHELEGKMVIVLCNIELGWSRGLWSAGALLCAKDTEQDKIELLTPPLLTRPGDKVFVPGYGRSTDKIIPPNDPRNPGQAFITDEERHLFDNIAKDMKVNAERQAEYRNILLRVEERLGFITTDSLANCPITSVPFDEPLYTDTGLND